MLPTSITRRLVKHQSLESDSLVGYKNSPSLSYGEWDCMEWSSALQAEVQMRSLLIFSTIKFEGSLVKTYQSIVFTRSKEK